MHPVPVRAIGLAVALSAIAPFPAVAAKMKLPEARTELLVAGGGPAADGSYLAGLAIDLPAGWHTYWKTPGDSGIPPYFDFSGSLNLGTATVDFPVPARHTDDTGTSMIYEGRVVLPIRVMPASPGAPVTLRMDVMFGLCSDVCLPAHADAEATLAADAPADAAAAAAIAEYVGRVPKPAPDAGIVSIDRAAIDETAGKGRLEVSVRDDGTLADLFASGPGDWYVAPPVPLSRADGVARYSVEMQWPPRTGRGSDTTLHFTVVGQDRFWDVAKRLE